MDFCGEIWEAYFREGFFLGRGGGSVFVYVGGGGGGGLIIGILWYELKAWQYNTTYLVYKSCTS